MLKEISILGLWIWLGTSATSAQPGCDIRRISTGPFLVEGISYGDGPHEVVCSLLELKAGDTTVITFAVNNTTDPNFDQKLRWRTYGEVVGEFWKQANRLLGSSDPMDRFI